MTAKKADSQSQPKTPKALERQATKLRDNGSPSNAREIYAQAAMAYWERDDKLKAADCQYMIGRCLQQEGDIESAIGELQKAAELYRVLDQPRQVAVVLRDLAMSHAERQEYDAALEWLQSAAAIQEQEGDPELGTTLTRIGLIYLDMEQYDDAKAWIKKGLDRSIASAGLKP